METEESHQYYERTTVLQKCCLIFIMFPFAFRQLTFKHSVKHPQNSYSRLSMLKVNRSTSTLKHTHFQAINMTPAHTGNLSRAGTGFYSRFSMQRLNVAPFVLFHVNLGEDCTHVGTQNRAGLLCSVSRCT